MFYERRTGSSSSAPSPIKGVSILYNSSAAAYEAGISIPKNHRGLPASAVGPIIITPKSRAITIHGESTWREDQVQEQWQTIIAMPIGKIDQVSVPY